MNIDARTRSLVPLCSLVLLACNGSRGLVGEYGDGSGSGSGSDAGSTGVGCDGRCDPDFAVASISGPNLYARKIHMPGDAATSCVGDRCPDAVGALAYAGEPVSPCAEDPQALASPLGVAEYCRISPLIATFGIDVAYTTPVDRTSFEEIGVAVDIDGRPTLWHSDVLAIEGPGTAFTGDMPRTLAETPTTIANFRNLTCIDRLAVEGIAWTPDTLDDLCSATWDDGGTLRPRRMAAAMTHAPVRGRYAAGGASCDTGDGIDTCCSSCDYELSVAVAKYGIDDNGQRRTPATAITCDPDADVLTECRDFVPAVDRSRDPNTYAYAWDGAVGDWPMPLGDKLRETHPADRPAAAESVGPACDGDDACDSGRACLGGQCRLPWTVECAADPSTTGNVAYCVDRRFDDRAAGACYVAGADFAHGAAGDRLASCDLDGDGQMRAADCCDAALGGADSCDPTFQDGVTAVARYDRDPSLPIEASCTCSEASAADPACVDAVASWCAAPLGDPRPELVPSPAGAFAQRVLEVRGSPSWDDEAEVMNVRIADLGGEPRGAAESCAEKSGRIPMRPATERWNDEFSPERLADHDLALCSGSSYRVVFAASTAAAHVRSELGGDLDGRNEFVFETPQFRVIPDSAFPSDALRITPCDTFALRFTNKFDASPTNLRKLRLVDEAGVTVAGGPDCSESATAEEIAAGAIPCLSVDLVEHWGGTVRVWIDPEIHGPVLQVGGVYQLSAPGLADISQMSDPEAYAAAFHDVCGMPLVLGDTPEVQALSAAQFKVDAACD